MGIAIAGETPNTQSSQALGIIASNIDMAADDQGPICQDTGMPTFDVHTPVGVNQLAIKKAIRAAVAEATKRGKLRPNSVDSLTGKNSGDNLGEETPVIHFEQWEQDEVEVKLILKGGGCENKNIQYSLPMELEHVGKAGRDLEGVRKCILHSVWQAQGQGCAPAPSASVSEAIEHRATSTPKTLFRTLDDVNRDARLQLGGLHSPDLQQPGHRDHGTGGAVTLIGCKVSVLNRLPASFFVSVAYDCWAFRRLGVVLNAKTGEIERWLYRDQNEPTIKMATEGFVRTGHEKRLMTPLMAAIRALKVGDTVLISGEMFTGRDAIHAHLMKRAAGDQTARFSTIAGRSPEMEITGLWLPDQRRAFAKSHTRRDHQALRHPSRCRQGGMGANAGGDEGARRCLSQHNWRSRAVLCEMRDEVLGVELLEFGIPEAMWRIHVTDFPAIVTMDAHGSASCGGREVVRNSPRQAKRPVF
jgi:fumarate hydratase class I